MWIIVIPLLQWPFIFLACAWQCPPTCFFPSTLRHHKNKTHRLNFGDFSPLRVSLKPNPCPLWLGRCSVNAIYDLAVLEHLASPFQKVFLRLARLPKLHALLANCSADHQVSSCAKWEPFGVCLKMTIQMIQIQ